MNNGAGKDPRIPERDGKMLDEILADSFFGLVFFVNRYVRDIHSAEDIAMDSVAAYLADRGRYDKRAALKTYLYTVARSRALNYLKKRRREATESLPDGDGPVDRDADLEEKVLVDEKRRAVNEAVTALPPDMRDAVWLVYFEEMTYKEAATVMKKKEKQIDNLIYRAKKILREKLKGKGVFGDERN